MLFDLLLPFERALFWPVPRFGERFEILGRSDEIVFRPVCFNLSQNLPSSLSLTVEGFEEEIDAEFARKQNQRPKPKTLAELYPPDARRPFGLREVKALIEGTPAPLGPVGVTFRQDEPAAIETSSGMLRIEPGEVTGTITLARGPGDEGEEEPAIAVVFDFRDASGNGWRHVSVFHAWLLVPKARVSTISPEPPPPGAPAFEHAVVLDWREDYEFEVEGDDPVRGTFRYTEAVFWMSMCEGSDQIDVLLDLFNHDDPRRTELDRVYLKYTIPIADLLWQRAPIVTDDEVIIGVDVDTDPLVQLLGDKPSSIPTSPLQIE